jgi:uncharacterized protein
LDDAYLKLLAQHFSRVHPGKSLDLSALQKLFTHIGYKPALMKDIVKAMSAEGIVDVDFALQKFMQDERNVPAWEGVLDSLSPLERAVLKLLAQGVAPMGKDSLLVLSQGSGVNTTLAKVRAALNRLRKGGILINPPKTGYTIEDRLFRDFLVQKLNSGKQ